MGSLKIVAEFCLKLKCLASDRQVSFSIFSILDVIFRVSYIVFPDHESVVIPMVLLLLVTTMYLPWYLLKNYAVQPFLGSS